MLKTQDWRPTSRYEFDMGECSAKNGFAQVDTGQDAWYFGTWANPWEFKIVNYCEGDICRTVCDSKEEFIAEIESMKKWNDDQGYGCKIDAYPSMIRNRFKEIGLDGFCH